MRGNTERGHGGNNGEYYTCIPISPLCAGDFTNDPDAIKSSVLSTSGQLEKQYPPQDFTTVKPDNNNNQNTSQQYTLLQAAKTANQVQQFCQRAEEFAQSNDLITLQLDFDTPPDTYANIVVILHATQLQPVAPFDPNYIYPTWIQSITLTVNDGSQTNTYTDFPGVFIYPILPIDYSQSNLLSQFNFFVFNDNNGYNYDEEDFTMYLGDLRDFFDITNISLISGNPNGQSEPTLPQQHNSCNDPILSHLFTSNTNPQQRSKRCPTFTTKDASQYTSVSSSQYTQSLQQQTACQDAAKLPQARISNAPPFGATVQAQPTFDPQIATYYESISRNFYLNSVKRLNRCVLPPSK